MYSVTKYHNARGWKKNSDTTISSNLQYTYTVVIYSLASKESFLFHFPKQVAEI